MGQQGNLTKGVDYPGIAAVYFCHDGNGNFLMGKRSANSRDEHGNWDIGGGGVELGQTIEQTLRQEIMEEYCTDVLAFEFLGFRDVFREHQGDRTHWLAMDFKVLVDPAKVRIGEPHKLDALEWFKLDSLPENIHSQWPKFFELYKDRL